MGGCVMSRVTAVLVDTVSIQKYVYSSNRLKENIGASRIVTNIYKESLEKSLKAVLNHDVDLSEWMRNPDNILIQNPDVDFEVGYIGGANALLFFRDETAAKEFIEMWTRRLLVEAPGLNTAFAISYLNMDNFQNDRDDLYKQLEQNKSRYLPQTFLPKHGITADCPVSGHSADIFKQNYDGDKSGHISSSSYAKHTNADIDDAQSLVEQLSKGVFTCKADVDKLGQTIGNNHIAIVYIDGNSMGEQFKACQNLTETRKLSKNLNEVMRKVYTEFLDFVIGEMDFYMDKNSGFKIHKDKDKYIIPFRPILIEGDDITFITDGRLGIFYAEKYLELMSSMTLQNGKKLSACAGVAISKTKYPFFRGYSLAEELCQSAKKMTREKGRHNRKDTSWLDFHVAYGGFSGSLEQIRSTKYKTQEGSLHFGPYLVACDDKSNEKNIYHFKKGIKTFMDKEKWPRSKVKEFREILTLGKDVSQRFIDDAKLKDIHLYKHEETSKDYSIKAWVDRWTPYFDMIELLDLFPERYLDIKAGE